MSTTLALGLPGKSHRAPALIVHGGCGTPPPGIVATPAKIAYWQGNLDQARRRLDYAAMAAAWKAENPRLGTVGCVALDAQGQLAAATPAEAARRVLEKVGPGAGLIALGADGEPSEFRNTPFMATARRPS